MKISARRLVNISEKRKKQEFKNSLNTHPHSNPTFKGVPDTIISKADESIMNIFSQHYGDIAPRIGKKIAKLGNENIIKSTARFDLEKGITSIKSKNPGASLLENVLFPFITLPLDIASWVLKKISLFKKVPIIQKNADKLYRKPLLRIPRKINELDQKTSIIKGMYDRTQQVVKDFAKEKNIDYKKLISILNGSDKSPESQKLIKETSEYIKSNLYKISNKFFDKNTGNFNTAFERPLNRIVSGLIPVLFLANDAYNLSVLCGDTKEMSTHEAKQRQKQEISRVLLTAYAQLIIFGAFTKKVNTNPAFVPVMGALIVLVTEIISRLSLGKPVLFLSKEQAKKYNKKHKNTKLPAQPAEKPETLASNITKPKTEDKSLFSEFLEFSNKIPQNSTDTNTEKPNNKKETKKALINMQTLKKAIAVLIGAGFVFSFLKNSSLTKNSKLVKGVKNGWDYLKNNIYNKLAFKDFEMSENKYKEVINTLKDVGVSEIVEGHELIKEKYAKTTADGIIKIYKDSFSEAKIPEIINSLKSDMLKLGIDINENNQSLINKLVKTAVKQNISAIEEKNYSKLTNKITELLLKNQLDTSEEKLKQIAEKISEGIKNNAKEVPVKIDTKIKPFVDFVIEPFKFIFGILKKPFNIVKSLITFPINKIVEKEMAKNNKLNGFEKTIDKVSKELFGEVSAKHSKINQDIFAGAMEKFQDKTRKLQKVINGNPNNPEKINEAKLKLKRYITDAVEKSFNEVSQSSNKNTDIAMLSKVASSLVTSAFLVADNYNMVMIKSNGENKDQAKEKANERIIQRLSALFYQSMFINLFNSTFKSLYNSSLLGMAMVVAPNTLTTEIITRKSIGMPVRRKTYEQLQEIDEKNENRKGLAGKYFKFMRLLTGKKPLKDRLPKDKTVNSTASESKTALLNSNNTKGSINYLDYFRNK